VQGVIYEIDIERHTMYQPDSYMKHPLPVLRGVSCTLELLLLELNRPLPKLYESINPELKATVQEQLCCYGGVNPDIGYVDVENNAVLIFVYNSLYPIIKGAGFLHMAISRQVDCFRLCLEKNTLRQRNEPKFRKMGTRMALCVCY
jgi:hypothetical protein